LVFTLKGWFCVVLNKLGGDLKHARDKIPPTHHSFAIHKNEKENVYEKRKIEERVSLTSTKQFLSPPHELHQSMLWMWWVGRHCCWHLRLIWWWNEFHMYLDIDKKKYLSKKNKSVTNNINLSMLPIELKTSSGSKNSYW
jgi:hypothetical protein